MFITAVCVIFFIKLRWPKNKSLYILGDPGAVSGGGEKSSGREKIRAKKSQEGK